MKTYKAGELREDMLVVPAHMLEGFVLVPVEPTPEMLESDSVKCHCGHIFSADLFDHVYRAMLAAAPKGDSHE